MKIIMYVLMVFLIVPISAKSKIYFVYPSNLSKRKLEYAAKFARKIQSSTGKSWDNMELLAFKNHKAIRERTDIFQKIVNDATVYMPIVCICYSEKSFKLIKSIDKMIDEYNKLNYKTCEIDKIINLRFKDKESKKVRDKVYNINIKLDNSNRCSCFCGDKALKSGASMIESAVSLINNLLDASKII